MAENNEVRLINGFGQHVFTKPSIAKAMIEGAKFITTVSVLK